MEHRGHERLLAILADGHGSALGVRMAEALERVRLHRGRVSFRVGLLGKRSAFLLSVRACPARKPTLSFLVASVVGMLGGLPLLLNDASVRTLNGLTSSVFSGYFGVPVVLNSGQFLLTCLIALVGLCRFQLAKQPLSLFG